MSPADDYSAFKEKEAPSIEAFAELDQLVVGLRTADLAVAAAEVALEQAKKTQKDLAEHKLPDLMDKMGLEKFTSTSGFQIEVKKAMRTSVPEGRRPEAWAWLDKNGHGGLLKRLLSVAFNRDQQADADKLLATLRAKFPATKQELWVEPPTLTAFVKEQVKSGADIPLDLFGAWEQRIAKVKLSKQ